MCGAFPLTANAWSCCWGGPPPPPPPEVVIKHVLKLIKWGWIGQGIGSNVSLLSDGMTFRDDDPDPYLFVYNYTAAGGAGAKEEDDEEQ